jgi:phosphoribosylformylglycinamidine synthase
MKNSDKMATIHFKNAGQTILMIGETKDELGATLYQKEIIGEQSGEPPVVDLALERKNGDFVRGLIESGVVDTCHDLSDGGLIAAISDMAITGNMGASITLDDSLPVHTALFSETQARYLIAVDADKADQLIAKANDAGVAITNLGTTGGDTISVNGDALTININDLKSANESWFPSFMNAAE